MRLSTLILLFTIALFANTFAQKSNLHTLRSPDGNIQINITAGAQLHYQVSYQQQILLDSCNIALYLKNGTILGKNVTIQKTTRRSVRDTITPIIKEKRAKIPDVFEELTLQCQGNYSLIFRAYNDGIAYRWVTNLKDSITILQEDAIFRTPQNPLIYYTAVNPRSDADIFHTSFESPYQHALLDTLNEAAMIFTPTMLRQPCTPSLVITESDLLNYPGMFLQKQAGSTALKGTFAPYPKNIKVTEGEFPQQIVTERENYIARSVGKRVFPWRVIVIAPTDGDLVMNDLVYRLATPNQLKDTDWIQPGTSTEEWIIGSNIYNVPFEAGINTETYKYYIDFASRFGLEYVMLDAGWSDVKDLFKITAGMNMDTLAAYAKEKGVSLTLWTLSMTLDRQLDSAMTQFQKWGVKCIMTDFMDRDDQYMVNFYQRIAEATAKYKIMVMFHGAYKPAGLQRTYPHLITREGALGSEFNIWSDLVTPEHDLLLPFIRQLSGPMDYEPGILDNATAQTFRSIGTKVMTQGTRTHQLALFLAYESPLQMFSGNPSTGFQEPQFMELLGSLPTVWDETKVLQAQFSDYLVLARRHGKDWYLAALNDWTPYATTITLDFLEAGTYQATICKDGKNAHRYPSDYIIEEKTVQKGDRMGMRLAPGGGWVVRLRKE